MPCSAAWRFSMETCFCISNESKICALTDCARLAVESRFRHAARRSMRQRNARYHNNNNSAPLCVFKPERWKKLLASLARSEKKRVRFSARKKAARFSRLRWISTPLRARRKVAARRFPAFPDFFNARGAIGSIRLAGRSSFFHAGTNGAEERKKNPCVSKKREENVPAAKREADDEEKRKRSVSSE